MKHERTINRAINSLKSDKAYLLKLSHNIPELQRAIPPQPDEWSIVELLEHVILAEEQLVVALEKSLSPEVLSVPFSLKTQFNKMLVGFVLSNGIKVPTVKSRNVEPTGTRTYEILLNDWEKARESLAAATEQLLKSPHYSDNFVFNHPRIGPCSVIDTIWFLSKHLRYHCVRAKRLFKPF